MTEHHIQLCDPLFIPERWSCVWFDSAHQHSVLYQEDYFYVVSYLEANPTPSLFCHANDLPQKVLFARISLSKELIAIQVSPSTVLVLDVITKKKYLLEIRSAAEGASILPQGVLWSDHGGGTQDLVIVTSKALEFYKISSKKLYCKPTRSIAHNACAFWYSHEHRMILTASHRSSASLFSRMSTSRQGASSSNSSSAGKEILAMDGYFLKAEKATMPLLELPPPDRMPRLELGPDLLPENIHLVSVCGQLLALVLFGQDGSDCLVVYQLQKTAHERTAILILHRAVKHIRVTTLDNLIVVHDLETKKSLLFDILAPPREKPSPMAIAMYDPLLPPVCIAQSQWIDVDDPEDFMATHRKPPVPKDLFRATDNSSNKGSGDDASVPRIYRFRELKFSLNPETSIASFPSSSSPSSPIKARDSSESLPSSPSRVRVQVHELISPLEAPQCYTDQFNLTSIDYAFHKSERVMWRVKLNLESIAAHMENLSERTAFLSRRGRRYLHTAVFQQYEDQCTDHSLYGNSRECQEAKQWLLVTVFDALRRRLPGEEAMAVLRALADSYAPEYHRLRAIQETAATNISSVDVDLELSEYFLHRRHRCDLEKHHQRLIGTAVDLNRTSVPLVHSRSQSPLPGGSVSPMSSSSTTTSVSLRNKSTAVRSLSIVVPAQSAQSSRKTTGGVELSLGLEFAQSNDPLEPCSPTGSDADATYAFLPDINLIARRVKSWKQSRLSKCHRASFVPTSEQNKSSSPSSSSLLADSAVASTEQDEKGTEQEMHVVEALLSAVKVNDAIIQSNINSSRGMDTTHTHLPHSDYVSLSLRRGDNGELIVSQTELISFVWIPFLLSGSCDYEHCSEVLTNYLVALSERGVEVVPALCLLHLHVLFFLDKYSDICNFLCMSLYKDNVEVALTVLQFAGMLEEESQRVNKAHCEIDSFLRCLKLYGIEMLWRLKQYNTVVKWYLTHGYVLEAIDLCKKRGVGKIEPGSIPGSEFFVSAISCLKKRRGQSSMSPTQFLLQIYQFLSVWDQSVMTIPSGGQESKLAVSISFPVDIGVEEKNVSQLRKMFGYST